MIRSGLLRAMTGLLLAATFLLAGGPGSAPAPVAGPVAVSRPVGRVAGTPCTVSARACVDLGTRRAWLLRDGAVALGPVPVSLGGPGEETPTGTFRVWRKDLHHISTERRGAPMPFSVFFDGGVAFHAGPLSRASLGCVHLRPGDASTFYAALRVGDQVQVRAVPVRAVPARPAQVRPVPRRPAPAPVVRPHRVVPSAPVVRPHRVVPGR